MPSDSFCRLIFASAAAASILFIADAPADEVQAKLNRDVTVGANHDVTLKSNQIVQILKISGNTAVIMVQLPDGSNGVFQIDSTAFSIIAPSVAPSVTNQPVIAAPPLPNATPAPAAPLPTPLTPTVSVPPPNPVAANPDLPEDKSNLVHVSWPQDSKLAPPYAALDDVKAGAYSYKLYLPPGYYEHPDFHYPALFIMAPEGTAGMGSVKKRAREEGWIVVMLMEARNGPWGPIYGDELATCADVAAKGIRIQEGLKFATGFSGGARGTSILTQIYPGFDGELLQGAAFAFGDDKLYEVEGIPRDHPYAVFMAVGTHDGNRNEPARLKDQLHDIPFKVATFEGGHQPAPVPQENQGLDWLIEQAFNGNTISQDLRQTGLHQIGFLEKRWADETDNAVKTDEAPALATFGEKLNLPAGSAEAIELEKIKNTLPLTP